MDMLLVDRFDLVSIWRYLSRILTAALALFDDDMGIVAELDAERFHLANPVG